MGSSQTDTETKQTINASLSEKISANLSQTKTVKNFTYQSANSYSTTVPLALQSSVPSNIVLSNILKTEQYHVTTQQTQNSTLQDRLTLPAKIDNNSTTPSLISSKKSETSGQSTSPSTTLSLQTAYPHSEPTNISRSNQSSRPYWAWPMGIWMSSSTEQPRSQTNVTAQPDRPARLMNSNLKCRARHTGTRSTLHFVVVLTVVL